MFKLLDFAKFAEDVYSDSAGASSLGKWSVQDPVDFENLRMRVYKGPGVSVLAYRGTANWRDIVQSDLAGIGLGGGVLGLRMNDAINFTGQVLHSTPQRNLWLVGHSLGGAYVQLLAAIFNVPGITFNAPGVVAMINQMDSSPWVRLAGALGSGAIDILASISGRKGAVDFLTKAAAGASNNAYASVLNYRGNMDPVSLVGVHVGAELATLQVPTQLPHPHSMLPIIKALEGRGD